MDNLPTFSIGLDTYIHVLLQPSARGHIRRIPPLTTHDCD
jgi:hypothetical protein